MPRADVEYFRPPAQRVGLAWWLIIALMIGSPLLVVVLFGSTLWGAMTLRYELTPTHLVIPYGLRETRIPRAAITNVTILTPTRGGRLWGTGLPGLQEGRWSFAETGPIRMYSTSTQPLTVIETPEGKWGISPADPEGFREALLTGKTGVWEPVPTRAAGFLVAFGLVEVAVLAVVVGIAVYLVRLRRNLGYRLTADALEVTGGLTPVRIPYRSITEVTIASPRGRPWRLWGVGMPGLLWGDFRWKEVAPNLRLYATRTQPLVLVRAGRVTYGLSPTDPEGFVAALRKRLGQ
nr:MAG: hypothetical protein DIU70_05110 [Bacillota bacterium]